MIARFISIAILIAAAPAGAEGGSAVQPDRAKDRTAYLAWLRDQYQQPPGAWPKPQLDHGIAHHELGTPGPVPAPEDNPVTEAKAKLGMSLFFDPRLSGSQQISCASCHDPELGWADGRSRGLGVFTSTLKRNTPGLAGIGHRKSLFWDGRAASLEDQARQVMLNPTEMGGDPVEIENRLAKEAEFYGPRFAAAFGNPAITFDRVVKALASFERSLKSGRTGFDRFVSGNHEALEDDALSGLHLFRTEARCLNCHNGPSLTDEQFHNAGLTYHGRELFDPGRHAITGKAEDMGKFRTPGLRNVSRTGPWMHNGVFPDLDGVLRLYNAGMPQPKPKPEQAADPLFPQTSPLLKPLKLSARDLKDLRAFLDSLAEPPVRVLKPPFPPITAGPSNPAK